MRHIPTLFRRELAGYFLGPMAFLILLAFQVIAWLNFWTLVDELSRNSQAFSGIHDPMNTYISGSPAFWMGLFVAIPALTMRLLAEERRSGTIETLLTAPVTETEVVVSKWLAGVVMYLVLLVPFFLYLPFLYYGANFRFDIGPVVALGIGLTSMGMMFIAIGLFFSSLTKNQIIAAVMTFVATFLLIIVTMVGFTYAVATRRIAMAEGMQFVSVIHQINTFGTGQLDLRFLALHLSASVLMLYLTVKVLENRRES
jgi:ABC-2 type transport system permease protein